MSGGADGLPEAVVARLRAVCLERLAQIESSWVARIGGQDDPHLAEQLQRAVHTLKGDARGLGLEEVCTLCQHLEDVIAFARSVRAVPEEVDLVTTMALQLIGILLRSRPGARVAGIDFLGFVRHMEEALGDAQAASAAEAPEEQPAPPSSSMARLLEEGAERLAVATRRRLAAAATHVFLARLVLDEPLRSRMAGVWDCLSREVYRFDATELATLFQRHITTVKDLAASDAKEVSLALQVASVRASPEVAEALDIGLLHAVCNAVAHGIEPPEERARQGKPRRGTLEVSARSEDRLIEVSVEDDGRGIDLDAVKRRAVERRLMPAQTDMPPSPTVIDEVLFSPGFSTAERVTGIAGRGLGLAAIRDAVARVGGSVSIAPRDSAGVRLTMRVPQARPRVDVHVFGGSMRDLLFAVPATWSFSVASPPAGWNAKDPLHLLDVVPGPAGIPARLPPSAALCFQRRDRAIHLLASSTPRRAVADRLCPTDEKEPAEVVAVDDVPAILLRPERLLMQGAP